MMVRLNAVSGSVQGKSFEFREPVVTIGREPGCQLFLEASRESRVSGRHCELFEQNGKLYVRDLDSLNGTIVDGNRIAQPVALRSGARIQLGEKGPEFILEVLRSDNVQATIANTLQARPANAEPAAARNPAVGPAPTKVGVGLMTLERHVNEAVGQAKKEAASHHKTSRRMLGIAVLGLLVVALGAAALTYRFSHEDLAKNQDEQQKRLAVLSKDVASVSEETKQLSARVAANESDFSQGLAALNRTLATKGDQIAALEQQLGQLAESESEERAKLNSAIAEGKKAIGEVEQSLAGFEDRNKAMFEKLQAPFKDAVALANDAVYSVFYRKGDHYTFMATAFAINPEKGLLGTNGHVASPCASMLESGNGQMVVRCNANPRYTYRIRKAFVHPGYKDPTSPEGPDVGLLEVDLEIDGRTEMLPAYLHPASDEELDKVASGDPIALLGFPGLYNQTYERPDGSTNVAKLVLGNVSQTMEFGGSKVEGRSFERLEHTCYSMGGNSGSPMFGTDGKVLAVLNSGFSTTMQGVQLPVGSVNFAVNVRFLKHLVKTHYGPGVWE
ncbi:MAG: FHA domain-containing protein [Planctomycetes bacterium]|nr:FHA domain-containing protein [Planctomycetota bacterium]